MPERSLKWTCRIQQHIEIRTQVVALLILQAKILACRRQAAIFIKTAPGLINFMKLC